MTAKEQAARELHARVGAGLERLLALWLLEGLPEVSEAFARSDLMEGESLRWSALQGGKPGEVETVKGVLTRTEANLRPRLLWSPAPALTYHQCAGCTWDVRLEEFPSGVDVRIAMHFDASLGFFRDRVSFSGPEIENNNWERYRHWVATVPATSLALAMEFWPYGLHKKIETQLWRGPIDNPLIVRTLIRLFDE